jgi:RimJ/RimL family protein N-acetyltransferase
MSTTPPAVLRRVLPSDAEAILEAFTSDDMSRQGDVRDLASAAAYARHLSENPFAFAVASEGSLVGVVALNVDHQNRLGWFWYWTRRSHRHRGLTKRAAATVANWALRDGGIERLELGHRANNPPSGAIARASGFLQEGLEREKFLIDDDRVDVLTYGRLRTDPWPVVPEIPLTVP